MSEEEVDLETSVQQRVGSVVVGKYKLDRVLGIGGMAAVYAATHRNQAEFAVKMLHTELSQSEDVRTRFLREGYIANSVKHPGAVRVVDDDVAEDGSAFLVMELLHGVSAEDLWFNADRQLPLAPVLALADQLLDVLAAAHAKTIVHRDIKPANVFVTNSGEVKVLDFGIARLRDSASLQATTLAGTMLGTPAFMSPEQALGRSKEIDGVTDLWAVGATLFSLISGHLVHEAETAPQLLLRAASSHARSLKTVAPDTPDPIVRVIDKALAFDRAARWQGAAEMRMALRSAYTASYKSSLNRQILADYMAKESNPDASEGQGAESSEPSAETESTEVPAAHDESPSAGASESDLPAADAPRPKVPSGPPPSELTKTKVERPPPGKLQRTLPMQQQSPVPRAPGPMASPPPPAPAVAAGASMPPPSSEPTSVPSAERPTAMSVRKKRALVPIVIAVALVIGLAVGVGAMLLSRTGSSGGAPPSPSAAPSP